MGKSFSGPHFFTHKVCGRDKISQSSSWFFLPWPRHVAYGVLVSSPETEPLPSALVAWSVSHWTTREVSGFLLALMFCDHLSVSRWEVETVVLYVQPLLVPVLLLENLFGTSIV